MNGLEALKRIRQETAPNTYCNDFDKEECCNTIERELKALEIIKAKRVNVYAIEVCYSATDYNDEIDEYDDVTKPLTEDEFDLLKEVLK